MTRQAIDVFLAVIQTGGISQAAQRLYISQPAVSRHIQALEEELGCTLLLRGRGKHGIELTEQGQDFIQVAEKWQQLWQEALETVRPDHGRTLRVAAIGSVSTCLMPTVIRSFLDQNPDLTLTFRSRHSREAYQDVADGSVDLALVSDTMHHSWVETIPAYREPMVLIAAPACELPDPVHPEQLDPSRQLRLPWNPEYDLWHSFWFSSGAQPRAFLDHPSLLEDFFSWSGRWQDSWAVAPISMAFFLRKKINLQIRDLQEGPPDEQICCLLGRRRKPELTKIFLHCLDDVLQRLPRVESCLRASE